MDRDGSCGARTPGDDAAGEDSAPDSYPGVAGAPPARSSANRASRRGVGGGGARGSSSHGGSRVLELLVDEGRHYQWRPSLALSTRDGTDDEGILSHGEQVSLDCLRLLEFLLLLWWNLLRPHI